MIIVTHDNNMAKLTKNRLYLKDGKIVQTRHKPYAKIADELDISPRISKLLLREGYNNLDNDNYWDGKIEEVRISNIPRSEAWLNASYHSMFTSGFITFGEPVNQSNIIPPSIFNATTINTGQINLG